MKEQYDNEQYNKMKLSFTYLKLKILLNMLREKDSILKIIEKENPETYKPQGISLKELSGRIGISYSNGVIHRFMPWLIEKKILIKVGKKKIHSKNEGNYIAESYDVDYNRIDEILFVEWETRVLFDRSHDYLYGDWRKGIFNRK